MFSTLPLTLTLLSNRKSNPGWVPFSGEGAFYADFGITAPHFHFSGTYHPRFLLALFLIGQVQQ